MDTKQALIDILNALAMDGYEPSSTYAIEAVKRAREIIQRDEPDDGRLVEPRNLGDAIGLRRAPSGITSQQT